MSDGKRFWGKPQRNEPDGSSASNAIPARDIFAWDDEGYLIIHNPSARIRQSWDQDFQG